MPYLDHLANGTDSDIDLYLLSVAGFPGDPDRQRVWFGQARNTRTEQIVKHDRPVKLPDEFALQERVIAALIGPRLELGSDEGIGIDTAGYRVTAHLLIRVLASRPRGSLTQAIAAFAQSDGARASIPGASESTIWHWWNEFSPAAHLGAVLLYHRHAVQADTASMSMRTSYSPIGAGSALAWAENVRIAAEQYRPPHSSKPLLDPERTWKMPPSLQLPNVPLNLPPADLAALQDGRWR